MALVENGKPLVGIIYDAINKRLARAIRGKGAFLNDQKISVSSERKISKFSLINLDCDAKLIGLREKLIKKTNSRISVLYSTSYGSFLVAAGSSLAEVYEYSSPWDVAAAKIIIEEAGGKTTDINGNEQRYDQKINGFIASNSHIHEELLDLISAVKS